jgi:hypothetical protein
MEAEQAERIDTTIHLCAILRAPDPERRQELREMLANDLERAPGKPARTQPYLCYHQTWLFSCDLIVVRNRPY